MLNNPGEITDHSRRSLEAGLITTYARPFGENNGLGALPQKFREFPDSGLQAFRERLIDSRNRIAGHNDRINLNGLLSGETLKEDPEKIQIEICDDTKARG